VTCAARCHCTLTMSGERSGPNAAFHALAPLGRGSYSGLDADTDRGVAVFLALKKERSNLKRALAISYKVFSLFIIPSHSSHSPSKPAQPPTLVACAPKVCGTGAR
jgi:hypothetical protein